MKHTAAITRKATRRKNDAYFTPATATQCLLNHVKIEGLVLEPCAGEDAIAKVFRDQKIETRTTDYACNSADDATSQDYWERQKPIDWVITNPPFNKAALILPKAYSTANIGVAFLLRLSYLEPCANRGNWLAEYPPNKLLIMPRISFTGDGNTDSCTTAWMIWRKDDSTQSLVVIPKG